MIDKIILLLFKFKLSLIKKNDYYIDFLYCYSEYLCLKFYEITKDLEQDYLIKKL